LAGKTDGTHLAQAANMGLERMLERTPALAGIDPKVLTRLAGASSEASLERGQWLWRAGDNPRALTIIRSGLVKLLRPTSRGRSAICGIFGPPESLGDDALLEGSPYPHAAVVETDTASVILVRRDVLLECANKDPRLALSMARGIQAEVRALHDKIDVLSAGAVDARLALLLLKLYDKFGDDFDDGTSRIPVALTRRELADLVATSFETAIRVMTRWEREGVVSTESDGFTLRNLQRLGDVAHGGTVAHAAE
jgi:CRP/FNR family transcriptional regulator